MDRKTALQTSGNRKIPLSVYPRDVFMGVVGTLLAFMVVILRTQMEGDVVGTLLSTVVSSDTKAASLRTTATAAATTTNSQVRVSPTEHYGEDKSGGWNVINIHFGAQNHLLDPIPSDRFILNSERHAQDESTKWFSQHYQDITVARLFDFETNLYYVDLASNDAVWASNTFALERNLNWHGLCVEPNPYYWHRLGYRTSCSVIGAISGGTDLEEIDFTMEIDQAHGPTGGIVGPDFGNKSTQNKKRRFTVSLLTLFKRFKAPKVIDYLSLDVEGAEELILKQFFRNNPNPLDYQIRCISIERPSDALMAILESTNHHKILDFKRGDTLWVHGDFLEQAKANLAKHPGVEDEAAMMLNARKMVTARAATIR
jgi:hypothetical protein